VGSSQCSEHLGGGDEPVQEPLEHNAVRAPGVDRPRAYHDRVHAVRGRGSGRLHGGQRRNGGAAGSDRRVYDRQL